MTLLSSDAVILKSETVEMSGFVNVASVKNHVLAHEILDAFKVWISKSLPFRNQQHGIGANEAFIIIRRKFNAGPEYFLSIFHGFRVVCRYRRALAEQLLDDADGWCVPHVVGSRFECQAPDAKPFPLEIAFKMIHNTMHKAVGLIIVDGFDGLENPHR